MNEKNNIFLKQINSFKNEYFIVTGASSGIGKQIAMQISQMGGNIIAVARRENLLKILVEELSPGDHHYKVLDLSINNNGYKLVNDVSKKFGKIKGYVHAAGISIIYPIQFFSTEDIKKTIDLNLIAALDISRGILKKGNTKDMASVVFISSITAQQTNVGHSIYSASKGGLISSVKALALEGAKLNIRFNSVSPGIVLTDLVEKTLNITTANYLKKEAEYPLGFGKDYDIANLVIFLLSDASRWITGENIVIDGGRLAH